MNKKFGFDLQRFASGGGGNPLNTWENQGTQGLTNRQITFYNRALIERLLPNLIWLKHGQKRPIPKKHGMTANFRKFNRLEPALEPIMEGITPKGNKLDITAIHAAVQQYGGYLTLTDLIDLAGIDPHVTEATQLLGEQASETLDIVVRDIVAQGTNVYYVGGGTERGDVASGNTIDAQTIRRIRQVMARNNVKPYEGKDYLAFIHPDVAYDIMGDDTWETANNYAKNNNIFDGEIGRLYGVRFLESTLCPIFEGEGDGGEDVYGTIVIGKNAYGVPDIGGSSKPETIIKALGSAGTSDPLDQRSSVGWKAMLTAIRLDELCILRVESATSVGALD